MCACVRVYACALVRVSACTLLRIYVRAYVCKCVRMLHVCVFAGIRVSGCAIVRGCVGVWM